MRLIDDAGVQLGIIALREALSMATEKNLDLVNVAPTAKPPVCRIMDFGKYKYEQSKREKDARKNQKIINVKEVRMKTPNIAEHDLQVRIKNTRKFLEEGDKVKVSVRFSGREITHPAIGQKLLEQISMDVQDVCVIERPSKLEGRFMVMILAPKPSS